MMTIRPADKHGPVLAGRGLAAVIREAVEAAVEDGERVVINLDGVSTVSPSFADELFAKLEPHVVAGDVRFTNVPDSIEPLVRFVVSGRRGPLPA